MFLYSRGGKNKALVVSKSHFTRPCRRCKSIIHSRRFFTIPNRKHFKITKRNFKSIAPKLFIQFPHLPIFKYICTEAQKFVPSFKTCSKSFGWSTCLACTRPSVLTQPSNAIIHSSIHTKIKSKAKRNSGWFYLNSLDLPPACFSAPRPLHSTSWLLRPSQCFSIH